MDWLADTREKAASALAARGGELDPGLPLSALLPSAPWAADVAPLLELDEHEGKLYLPGGLEPFAVEDAALARQLEREGRLVVLGGGLVLSPHAYEHLETIVVGECTEAGTITLARFRDLSGLSRRTAQLVLERFDSDRVTLRMGDVRRLRRRQSG